MNIAYIISAYKNPNQLVRLVRRLDTGGNSFFLHIDGRSPGAVNASVVNALGQQPNVHFLSRHRCYWGGFGHVRATLKGIQALTETHTPFDYAVLLTGQDYPIKSNNFIDAFFQHSGGRSYLGHFSIPGRPWENGGLDRIERWHFHVAGRHLAIPGWRGRLFRRSFPAGFKPYGGSGYWCLSRECIELIHAFTRQCPEFVRFFRHVYIPDEIIFHTILLNSPLKDTLVNDDLRYIQWNGPRTRSPSILKTEDFPPMVKSPHLFARKFDERVDPRVLDMVDQEICP